MKKLFTLLLCLLISAPLFAQWDDYSDSGGSSGYTSDKKDDKPYNPFITAYAGIGYYRWHTFNHLFESSTHQPLEQKIDPYIMKKFYVKADLWIINAGLEYLTSKFTDFSGITKEENLSEEDTPLAKYLKFFAGVEIWGMKITFNTSFKKFRGTMKSNGIKTLSAGIIPVYYYPEKGSYVQLNPGDEISWYTMVSDYELLFSFLIGRKKSYGFIMSYDIGFRYIQYKAPQKIRFGSSGMSLGSDITAVMMTEYQIYNLSLGFNIAYKWKSGLYLEYTLPAVLGLHDFKNSYIDPDLEYPFNYTAGGRGKLCIGYKMKHVKIEGGIDYSYYISNSLGPAKLKKDITYQSETDGSVGTATKGSTAEINTQRLELFWGVYLHAYIMF